MIAEGVEKKEQVIYLNRLGVDEIQGYYFYKPMSIEEQIQADIILAMKSKEIAFTLPLAAVLLAHHRRG